MSRRAKTRTGTCSPEDAAKRLADAQKYLEVAELIIDDKPQDTSAGVSTTLAVFAGIAAADAACCKALGEHSRGQDHREAIALVKQVEPGGRTAATALTRLTRIKTDASYGLGYISQTQGTQALKQARSLVAFAEKVLDH